LTETCMKKANKEQQQGRLLGHDGLAWVIV
jgi:hypothetical protein